jgi:hypothetical protein
MNKGNVLFGPLFVLFFLLAIGSVLLYSRSVHESRPSPFRRLDIAAEPGVSSSTSAVKQPTVSPAATTTTPTLSQIGILTADPSIVFAGSSTVVTITCQLTDPRVISTSVNLQQLNSAGTPLGVIGSMAQNPESPSFYSIQIPINSASPEVRYYRASAGYTGALQRLYSRPLTLTVTSIHTSNWSSYTTHSGYRFMYPSNWVLKEAEDGTVTISLPETPQVDSLQEGASIEIELDQNPNGLATNQYFNGQMGPDLYTDTSNISTITVASMLSTKFVGLAAVPSDEVIVTPVTGAFVVVYASVPDEIVTPFLSSLNFQ